MTPLFLQTAILKIRYAAPGNKVDDFAAIQAATAQDVDAAMGQSIFMPGDLKSSAAVTVPAGWLACNGAAVSRAGYPKLFAAIGSSYGAGDGSSTFNLPDYQGRVILGAGSGSGLTARSVGQTGGAEAVALTDAAQNAPHNHADAGHEHPNQANYNTPGSSGSWIGADVLPNNGAGSILIAQTSVNVANLTQTGEASANIQQSGGGEAHGNMQPFAVASVFIKT